MYTDEPAAPENPPERPRFLSEAECHDIAQTVGALCHAVEGTQPGENPEYVDCKVACWARNLITHIR